MVIVQVCLTWNVAMINKVFCVPTWKKPRTDCRISQLNPYFTKRTWTWTRVFQGDIHRENQSAEAAAINTVCKPWRPAGGFFVSEFAPISLTKPFQKECCCLDSSILFGKVLWGWLAQFRKGKHNKLVKQVSKLLRNKLFEICLQICLNLWSQNKLGWNGGFNKTS